MKNYTMNFTEEELLYVRTALCNKNIKHTTNAIQCRRNGDKTGEEYNMKRRNTGHNILDRIDAMREC